MVGDLVWKKLERRGGFKIPESMLDVRDWAKRSKMTPSPDTPLEQMRRIVRDDFGGDIGIWGKVERVEGFEWDVYDFWIRIADFSVDPPQMIYQPKTARTKTVSEIPHLFVDAALDLLYGVTAKPAERPDRAAEDRWRSARNLVRGDFETGAAAPAGWDPLPEHVARVAASVEGGGRNRVIRFNVPEDVAASAGVLYYSDYFPVEAGARYRLQCRWRTTGSSVKVFVKCYDEADTKYSAGKRRSSTERREVYRSQQNLSGAPGVWNTHTQEFTPQHTHYTPRWGRVMLYAYWPAGVVEWDDVVLKQVAPARADDPGKVKRPSLETKVRSDELGRP
jgi:hypothetical protein